MLSGVPAAGHILHLGLLSVGGLHPMFEEMYLEVV